MHEGRASDRSLPSLDEIYAELNGSGPATVDSSSDHLRAGLPLHGLLHRSEPHRLYEQQVSEIVRDAIDRVLELTPPPRDHSDPHNLFRSPHAEALKREIVDTGKKLWRREYVDGNGGNISARLTEHLILCTPTLISKGDLTPEDICLVDLNSALVCGNRPQTSEILLHLEIYKAIPHAMAVVHCHPPYGTAHAIAGIAPPPHLLPEQEVFIGPVAISPYDTPGTAAFARSVLPFIETHRTVLLANHGVVSWAGTVTHAEWAIEILETYCKTAHLARQLNPNLPAIPPDKLAALLETKRQLGIPDPRFSEQPPPAAPPPNPQLNGTGSTEALRESLTRQLLTHLAQNT